MENLQSPNLCSPSIAVYQSVHLGAQVRQGHSNICFSVYFYTQFVQHEFLLPGEFSHVAMKFSMRSPALLDFTSSLYFTLLQREAARKTTVVHGIWNFQKHCRDLSLPPRRCRIVNSEERAKGPDHSLPVWELWTSRKMVENNWVIF